MSAEIVYYVAGQDVERGDILCCCQAGEGRIVVKADHPLAMQDLGILIAASDARAGEPVGGIDGRFSFYVNLGNKKEEYGHVWVKVVDKPKPVTWWKRLLRAVGR